MNMIFNSIFYQSEQHKSVDFGCTLHLLAHSYKHRNTFSHACLHRSAHADTHKHTHADILIEKGGNPGPSCLGHHTWPVEMGGAEESGPTASVLTGG